MKIKLTILYKSIFVVFFLMSFIFVFASVVQATEVDRMSATNMIGYAGQTIKQEITLKGTDPERSGYWYTHYKKSEGDSDKMDITSWITFEPKEYTIKQEETKVFTVNITIPKDAELGLWGATSVDAAQEGHSGERRTYIVFKDASGGGNVYSGLLLPVSVKVVPSPDILAAIMTFIRQNLVVITMAIVIAILLAIMLILFKKKRR